MASQCFASTLAAAPAARLARRSRAPAARPRPARRSLTIAANVTHMASVLQRPLARAQQMFDVGAYTHWYRRHGCEDSDIEAAIEAVRCIADAYRDADEEAAAKKKAAEAEAEAEAAKAADEAEAAEEAEAAPASDDDGA